MVVSIVPKHNWPLSATLVICFTVYPLFAVSAHRSSFPTLPPIDVFWDHLQTSLHLSQVCFLENQTKNLVLAKLSVTRTFPMPKQLLAWHSQRFSLSVVLSYPLKKGSAKIVIWSKYIVVSFLAYNLIFNTEILLDLLFLMHQQRKVCHGIKVVSAEA